MSNENGRKQKEYNKLVGRKGNDFYFCDYLFIHSDGFRGATGTVLSPVSKERYEETQDSSNSDTIDRVKEIWQMAVADDRTEQSLEDFVEDVVNIDGDEFFFDLSGFDLHDQIREVEPEFNEDDYPIFECIGGGRCFDSKMVFDKVYDEELLTKIRAIESKKQKVVV